MIIPEGFSNARYIFTHVGIVDPMSFGLGCQGEVGQTPDELAGDLAFMFKEQFAYAPEAIIAGWTFEGVEVTTTVAGEPVIGQNFFPVVGDAPTSGCTAHTALLIRKNTARGGRKYRGRMYWPPFALREDQVEVGGQINSSYIINQALVLNLWLFEMKEGDNQVPPWLLHSNERDPVTGIEVPGTAADPTPITQFSVQSLVASQRRRIR